MIIGHGGDTVLFHTEMDLLPQEGVGIYYTFNSRGRGDAVYEIRQALFDAFMDRYHPAPAQTPEPTTWPSAKKDAAQIAGVYQSSRRVEHGFLSLFYLLQQSTIVANRDGTITAPEMSSSTGVGRFREVAPQLWRKVRGTHELALERVSGIKTVIDSEDPISVLQAVPLLRSMGLNLTVLMGSAAVLVWSLVLWPLSHLLNAASRCLVGVSHEVKRLRFVMRIATAVDVAYLVAWVLVLQPALENRLQFYSHRIDPLVLTLEISGLLAIFAAVSGIWVLWRLFRVDTPWLSRVWSGLVVAALLGIVWIGWVGGLIGVNLNY